MQKSQFEISGQLIDAITRAPMVNCSVITETGIRDDNSPLFLHSVGPVAQTNQEGNFLSKFFTLGISEPSIIEVHIEFSPGVWRCCIVPLSPQILKRKNKNNMFIDLGTVEVDYNKCQIPIDNDMESDFD
jgi:hypothetical protein